VNAIRKRLRVVLTVTGLSLLSAPGLGQEGFILKADEGELIGTRIVVKASPRTGTSGSILVQQTFQRADGTGLHAHDQGDELFYVVSGQGMATIGDLTGAIDPGDVIFAPRGQAHEIRNLNTDEPLRIIFFMDSPELVELFRANHERRISEPDRPVTPEERDSILERTGGLRIVTE